MNVFYLFQLDYWFELGEPRVLKAPLVKSWSLDGYGFRNSATFRLPDIRKVVSRAKKDGAVVLFLIIRKCRLGVVKVICP